MLDWIKFFESNSIQYWRGSGANVEINCIFCNGSDQGHHLSVSLEGNGFRCWRNTDHRGRNPARLIMALLKCSYTEAEAIAGIRRSVVPTDQDLAKRILSLLKIEPKIVPIRQLCFPTDYGPILLRGRSRLAFHYLISRKYTMEEVPALVRHYNLMHTNIGAFSYRIIFPIYMEMGLVNWTGRAISENAPLRYRTLTTDQDKSKALDCPPALVSIERTLWNYMEIKKGGRNIILAEGPFDAMRIDFIFQTYAPEREVRATCMFGKQLSDHQINLLEAIRDKFDNLILVLDRDSILDMPKLSQRLSHLECSIMFLPKKAKDPADLTREEIIKLFS